MCRRMAPSDSNPRSYKGRRSDPEGLQASCPLGLERQIPGQGEGVLRNDLHRISSRVGPCPFLFIFFVNHQLQGQIITKDLVLALAGGQVAITFFREALFLL